MAKRNMPLPTRPRRLSKTIRFVARRPRQFHASLCQSGGKPISIAAGFVEDDLALMIYQVNDRAYRALNPSLMLRTFLVEHLIELGIRHLAFVGGCAGVLLHQCTIVPMEELLLVCKTITGRIKYLSGATLADPTNRIARLTPRMV